MRLRALVSAGVIACSGPSSASPWSGPGDRAIPGLRLTATPEPVPAGAAITYRVRVGTGMSIAPHLTLHLPVGATQARTSGAGWTCEIVSVKADRQSGEPCARSKGQKGRDMSRREATSNRPYWNNMRRPAVLAVCLAVLTLTAGPRVRSDNPTEDGSKAGRAVPAAFVYGVWTDRRDEPTKFDYDDDVWGARLSPAATHDDDDGHGGSR